MSLKLLLKDLLRVIRGDLGAGGIDLKGYILRKV
jgi:hypothetical protein